MEYLKLKNGTVSARGNGNNTGVYKKSGTGIVILGAPRSGISVVAGALSKAGIYFDDKVMPAEYFNPRPILEDTDIVAINEEILRTFNSSFKDIGSLPENWHRSFSILPLKESLKDLIEKKCANADIFGLKDSRISILLPLYLDIFKEMNLDMRFVVCERSVAEIVASLKEQIDYSLEDSIKLYKIYKTSIENNLKGQTLVRVSLDQFIERPMESIKNIYENLRLSLSYDEQQVTEFLQGYIDRSLKHHTINPEDAILDLVTKNDELHAEFEKHKSDLDNHFLKLQQEIDIHIENQKYLETHVGRLHNTLSHRDNRIQFLEEERQKLFEKDTMLQGHNDLLLQNLHERLDAIERSLSWRVVHAAQRVLDTLISPKSVLRKPYVKLLRVWQKKPRVINYEHGEFKAPSTQSKEVEIAVSPTVDVLFINHEESRTGAPRILFEIAKEVKNKYPVAVISKMKGGMSGEFAEIFKDNLFYPHENLETRDRHEMAKIMLLKLKPKMVYVNSIVSYEYAAEAKKLGIPVIFHVHEMASAYEVAIHQESHADFASFADIFIVVSEATKRDLIKVMNVDESKVRLIHEFIDSGNVLNLAKAHSDNVVEDMLGIQPDESLVVSMGTFDKRKGGDYFVKIAKHIAELNQRHNSKVKMLWIGRRPRPHDLLSPMFKDYSKYFIHIDETDNPFPFLHRANVFFLSSREDPFPLVVLEAMSLGKPVVTFTKSGGAIEAGENSAIGLKEFNIDKAAHVLHKLSLDKDEQSRRGNLGRERQKLYEKSVILPKIMGEIDAMMAESVGAGRGA